MVCITCSKCGNKGICPRPGFESQTLAENPKCEVCGGDNILE
jgi:hypothetical protein